MARRWRDLISGLGEALLDLLAAELEALKRDFARSGRGLLVVLGLFGAALVVAFWLVAAAVGFVIALLSLWLPVWGATLSTVGLLLVVTAILAGVGWWRLRRLDGPSRIFERRWREHREWWRERILEREERRIEPEQP
jgi:hypothetical protein